LIGTIIVPYLRKYIDMCSSKIENIQKELIPFCGKYQSKLSDIEVEECIQEYLRLHDKWRQEVLKRKKKEKWMEDYEDALGFYSCCLYRSDQKTFEKVFNLNIEADTYENKRGFQNNTGYQIYFFIGSCWAKLDKIFNKFKTNAIEAFKKSIYYQFSIAKSEEKEDSQRTSSNYIGYSFRKLENYLYSSLENEEITLSPPYKFNDIFDCPIFGLLEFNNKDVEIPYYLKAYKDMARVRCFMKDSENEDNVKAYLNNKMWGLYGDSHYGICLRYHLNNNKTNQDIEKIDLLRDIVYSDELKSIDYKDLYKIDHKKAFFLKGKEWEDENELRYLLIDRNSIEDYPKIKAKNMLSAVYFGAKCSDDDKKVIMKILKGRQWIDFNGEKHNIEFYNIKLDEENFMMLKAEKIKDDSSL